MPVPKNKQNDLTPAVTREFTAWLAGYQVGDDRHIESQVIANKGHVGELAEDGGTVEAMVHDEPPRRVVLQFFPIDSSRWDLFWKLLTAEALREFRKGEIGTVLRNALAVAEIPLLPARYKELRTTCTCAEWLKPCKHALAVLRVLGKEIETDPLLLVRLRGGGPREVMEEMEADDAVGEPLRTDAVGYWGDGRGWDEFTERALAGGLPARLLKRLGPVSVYGVRMEPESMFKPVYEGVASEAKVMLEGIRKKVKK